jgi:hypothetical protein
MNPIPLFFSYLGSIELRGVADAAVLGLTAAVALAGLIGAYAAIQRARLRVKEGMKGRRTRLGLVFTVITAAMALGVSYQGMLHFFEQLDMSGWVLYFFCGFIEFGLVTSALLSREFKLDQQLAINKLEAELKTLPKGSEEATELQEKIKAVRDETDQAGRAVWALALLAGGLAATKADHGFGEVLLRLSAPLVAALFWDWALRADIRAISVAKAAKTWMDDVRDLVDRILIKLHLRKPTSLNATQRAEEQQINNLVDGSFHLRSLDLQLASATNDAQKAAEGQDKKFSKRILDLTADRDKAVRNQRQAALTLMELGLWTPRVEHIVNIRLHALFNLEGLADPDTVAERAEKSRAALAAITINHAESDGDTDSWKWNTGEFNAFFGNDFDAPVSPAGPRAVPAQPSRAASSGHSELSADTAAAARGQVPADTTGTARGQNELSADTLSAAAGAGTKVPAGTSQNGNAGSGQRAAADIHSDDQIEAAFKELVEKHGLNPKKISSRKLSEHSGAGKTKANDWLNEHVRNTSTTETETED